MPKIGGKVVVFWADKPQFTVQTGPFYEKQVAGLIDSLTMLLSETFGDEWWDCAMLRKAMEALSCTVTKTVPTDDNFYRVDVH